MTISKQELKMMNQKADTLKNDSVKSAERDYEQE